MFELLKQLWMVPEQSPRNPTVIVPLGYGTLADHRLADATAATLKLAIGLAHEHFPDALIAFGNSSHCFCGSEIIELKGKMDIANGMSFPATRVVSAGGITNSVIEARAVRDALGRKGISPTEILLITDDLHGRGALYIWSRVFPGARLSLKYTRAHAYQADHIFPLQRNKWSWFEAGILRQVALRVMGIDWVSRKQHVPKHVPK